MFDSLNLTELIILLTSADEAYYFSEEPIMSDEQYNTLKERVPAGHPYLIKIGFKPPKSRLELLPTLMASQNKVKTIEELFKWAESKNISPSIEMILTPKLDGNSLVVDETLATRAWTRGDGVEGMAVHNHFLEIRNKKNPVKDHFNLSMGEAIISKENFEIARTKVFRTDGKPYTTARSMVAGLFLKDEPSEGLQYIDYIRYDCDNRHVSTKEDKMDLVNYANSIRCPYQTISLNEITNDLLQELYKKWSQVYCIDGIIIEINDLYFANKLGREISGNPAYSRAYKSNFEERAITKIIDIRWQPSKDRLLIPVADIEPVVLEGATVDKVTLYNARYVHQQGLAKGVTIEIIRSGGVIPKIIKVINPKSKAVAWALSIPDTWNAIETDWDGVNLFLTQSSPEIDIQGLLYFFKAFNVEIGTPSLTQFYKAGFTSISDILNMGIEELEVIPGFGRISGEAFLNELKTKVFITPLARLLAASNCFKGMAEKTLKLFPAEFLDLNYLEQDSYFNSYVNKYKNIDGIGITSAIAYVDGWQEFLPFWETIKDKFIIITAEQKGTKFVNKSLVFSGFRDEELKQQFEALGGDVKTSLSKGTTYLVLKDINSVSSKAGKAKEFGTLTITRDKLIELING